MMKRPFACLIAGLLWLLSGLANAQFDHRHAAWSTLVQKHVRWLPDNKQSQVDYAGFQRDRGELRKQACRSQCDREARQRRQRRGVHHLAHRGVSSAAQA